MEIVRGYFDARRAEGREAVFKFLARDVRWEARADFPDAGVYVGHNGVRAFFERFRPSWAKCGLSLTSSLPLASMSSSRFAGAVAGKAAASTSLRARPGSSRFGVEQSRT